MGASLANAVAYDYSKVKLHCPQVESGFKPLPTVNTSLEQQAIEIIHFPTGWRSVNNSTGDSNTTDLEWQGRQEAVRQTIKV